MFDKKGRFVIENYMRKSTFSSFLPGISGRLGIPIWSFYVNRGQAITSFGVRDKNHAIMEFSPAHQAYQYTDRMGFRTFLKIDDCYLESFRNHKIPHTMYIGSNELEIEEKNEQSGIQTNVLYYTLPGEKVGALIRRVTITNISDTKKNVQVLDGMPALIPYGIDLDGMKMMTQTLKAWMQVEDLAIGRPFYHVRFSTLDSTMVQRIDGGNFYLSWNQEGEELKVLADPSVIFGNDTSLDQAELFREREVAELYQKSQVTVNQLPCAFSGTKKTLHPKEKIMIYSMIGQAEEKETYHEYVSSIQNMNYFEQKYKEAKTLTEEIGSVVKTKTANPVFDRYCEQCYIDNILRGGYPIRIAGDHIFYLYSRKHGDIERDYNFFSMLPEFYSQGNANYRDVNQNRRCDSIITPIVTDENIKLFYNLIQLDGYNPLSVQMTSFQVEKETIEKLCNRISSNDKSIVAEFLAKEFTPGELYHFIDRKVPYLADPEQFISEVMNCTQAICHAEFAEGYWTDHWSYNLDLIETYLAIYPEKERELLYKKYEYTYYQSQAVVLPRSKRYVKTEKGIRQYHCVEEKKEKIEGSTKARTSYGHGVVYSSSLMTKLLIIAVNKTATLDPYGMGIEMEGGKPGWYDALNGLPSMFGSSMPDTYELYRMLTFMLENETRLQEPLNIPIEVSQFLEGMIKTAKECKGSSDEPLNRWKSWNQLKEEYREKTKDGIDGTFALYRPVQVIRIIDTLRNIVREGIERALCYGEGICPTYFAYEVTEFEEKEGTILPLRFEVIRIPYFLEGPVHYLKVLNSKEKKKKLYERIKNSTLYDQKLQMYKVNESLERSSYELGRCRAFTPGWLENESIWLHMEYKYLLELLKGGLYEEFIQDLKTTCIPFLDPEIYGRSTLENSSFIASSANPDEKIHGKGFVARLSGSTIEFIDIWRIMMFGERPFTVKDGKLQFQLRPTIPSYLIGGEKEIQCRFMNSVEICYQVEGIESIIPGRYRIKKMQMSYKNGETVWTEESFFSGKLADDIRKGKVIQIKVFFEKII